MLVSYDKRFFFRSIVRFYTVAERDAILVHLASIEGQVFAAENRELPFGSDQNPEKFGNMICDFQSQADRNEFDLYVTADLRLGTTKRERLVRELPKDPTPFESEYDLTKTKARRRLFGLVPANTDEMKQAA